MTISIYKNTATKDIKSKRRAIYAFGRDANLDGYETDMGGYALWCLRDRFVGQAGNLLRKWELVDRGMSYSDAVALMNKRVKHKAYA